ncbi:MAG: cysteine desulfurase NifS [Nitrospirota bacterium]
MKYIYLDHAATTPVHPKVAEAMLPYLAGYFGNPSSLYEAGRITRQAIQKAREKVAGLLGAKLEEIVFTSGGTESDNLAIKGIAYANRNKGNHIITTSIEHNAVMESCRFLMKNGWKVTFLPVDSAGIVDPDDLRKAIVPDTILISVMHANNEIGSIQPIEEIGKIAKERDIYFHVDAVQTFGHIPTIVDELKADLLSISAHKFYGPKGVGAIYIRKGTKIVPMQHGGEQESGRRASTENVAGIAGIGAAVEEAAKEMESEAKRLTILREKFIFSLFDSIPDVYLNGHPTQRLPNNVNISIDSAEGEALLIKLDFKGIAVSTGSACSSGSNKPSHVLVSIGVSPELVRSSLRFTFGHDTTEDDLNYVTDILKDAVQDLRAMSPHYDSSFT